MQEKFFQKQKASGRGGGGVRGMGWAGSLTIHLLIHSIKKCCGSVSGSVLGSGITEVNEQVQSLMLWCSSCSRGIRQIIRPINK